MNTNCLSGMQCPNPDCRSEGPFRIAIHTMVTVFDSGTDDDFSDIEWDDDAACTCVVCSHTATVKDFSLSEEQK